MILYINTMTISEIKEKFKISTEIKVRYSDLDTLKHVNNARYLSFLEEARIDYIGRVIDFNRKKLEFGVVVARIEIDYKYPVLLTDELKVYTRCSRIGNKSFTFECVFVINDSTIAAVSKAVIVSVNNEGQTIVVPENWKKGIEEFEK